jgi:putative hydrolase of the HAD superfamily
MSINGEVRAIIFDLDDTLRSNYPHANDFFSDFVSSKGVALEEEDKQRAHRWRHEYWAMSDAFIDDLDRHNGIDQDSFWENYTRLHLASLGVSDEDNERLAPAVHKHMRKKYKPESRLVPQTLEILDSLRASGYLVGVLTNRSRSIYKEMDKLELDLHLDFFLTASQLGTFKPNKDIFLQMLKFIQVAPEEAVYVGDNYVADVEGAKNADLQPVLMDPDGLYPKVDFPVIEDLQGLFSLLNLDIPDSD